jgi:AcrR family transcriptional regulator
MGEVRRRLLRAAADEFSHRGFADANVGRIAEFAGFSKGLVYNYFLSKETLYGETLEALADAHLALLLAAIEGADRPERRLLSLFEAHFAYVKASMGDAQLLAAALQGLDYALSARVMARYAELGTSVAERILVAGVSSGDFASMDVAETGALVSTLLLGASKPMSPAGDFMFEPGRVAEFILRSIRRKEGESK